VTPILHLPSNTNTPVEGVVADFDVGQSRGPYGITLLPVLETHKDACSDVGSLLALKPAQVKQTLSDSGDT
jgi:hypothetical protein